MHIFLSAGEPSGDLHAANLAKALLVRNPSTTIVGFGGERLAAAGGKLLYPLTQLSIMWLSRSIVRLPKFFRLADQAERYFLRQKPDAVVLVDYPGFHWHLAKRATRAGIPVYYFVPPQLWAWGGWRTRKMRKTVDTVMTALPFEDDWYRKKNINTHYVGHPYFDELGAQVLDESFVQTARTQPGDLVAILPGSRNQEVAANVPMMLEAARHIAERRPGTRFMMAAFNQKQADAAREQLAQYPQLNLEIHVGRTPEIIEACKVCIAVSGSVGLELMYRGKPTIVVYKYSLLAKYVSRAFMKCKYISLVNLLAEKELFPEYLTERDDSGPIAAQILDWLSDDRLYANLVHELNQLRDRVAVPGACERAAEFLTRELAHPTTMQTPSNGLAVWPRAA